MSKSSTIIEHRTYYCPICKTHTDNEMIHLATKHSGVEKRGEIYWLNRHEAIYGGRYYRKERHGLSD